MTAGPAASRRVLARTPVAPLPASSPTRPVGINGRTSAPPDSSLPDVCSFQLPKVCSFRLPLTDVPGRYVAFLRSGDPRLLAPIVEHNRLDLVSLGVLAGLACQLVRDGATAGTDPEQALGLGRIYERVGRRDATITCYRRAARTDGTPATRAEALRRLALHHRRGQRHVEAADAWQRLLELPGLAVRLQQEASVALAVHHEHRAGNLRTAQRFAEQALETEWHSRRRSAVEHRLRRLGRKIAARPAKCGSLLAAGLEGAMTPNGEPKTAFAAPPAAFSGWRR